MTLEAAVSARIATQVPTLAGGIEDVAELAALIAEGALPQRQVAAFVCPLGFDDKGGDSSSGAHTQLLDDAIGVVLCIRAQGDVKARRALPTITSLKTDVINAVAGWTPGNTAGVFRVIRGRLVSVAKGLVIYQIDFALTDQLRIMS